MGKAKVENLFETVFDKGRVKNFKKGQFFFHRGDIGGYFFIIHSGQVELFIEDRDGREVIAEELGPKSFFGQECIAKLPVYKTNAIARDNTVVSIFSRALLYDIVHYDTQAAIGIINALSERYFRKIDFIEDFISLSNRQRISKQIYELAKIRQTNILRITHNRLSKFLAITRSNSSLALKSLEEMGIILISYGKIEILDHEKLRQQFL